MILVFNTLFGLVWQAGHLDLYLEGNGFSKQKKGNGCDEVDDE